MNGIDITKKAKSEEKTRLGSPKKENKKMIFIAKIKRKNKGERNIWD